MCVTIFFPGGASGVTLKLNSPKMYVKAETLGYVWQERRRFRVMFAFLMNLSHMNTGDFGLTLARTPLK